MVKETIKKILILDVLCGLLFLSASVLLGIQNGFKSYLMEVSSFGFSAQSLLLYVLLLSIYALVIEFVLRLIQRRLSKKIKPVFVITLVASIYAASHLRHGPAGFIYAFPIGVVTAGLYRRWGDWKVFALWHMQWDLGALAVFVLLSVLNVSPFSDAVQYTYKHRLMAEKRIVYLNDVGWVDAAHYWGAWRRACAFHGELEAGHDEVRYSTTYRDLLGVERTEAFSLSASGAVGENNREKAVSLTRFASLIDEQMQANASVWSGMRLSAWSNEDIRSVNAALRGTQSEGFWSHCETKTGPMPNDFVPPGAEWGRENNEARWPTFDAFIHSGLF